MPWASPDWFSSPPPSFIAPPPPQASSWRCASDGTSHRPRGSLCWKMPLKAFKLFSVQTNPCEEKPASNPSRPNLPIPSTTEIEGGAYQKRAAGSVLRRSRRLSLALSLLKPSPLLLPLRSSSLSLPLCVSHPNPSSLSLSLFQPWPRMALVCFCCFSVFLLVWPKMAIIPCSYSTLKPMYWCHDACTGHDSEISEQQNGSANFFQPLYTSLFFLFFLFVYNVLFCLFFFFFHLILNVIQGWQKA